MTSFKLAPPRKRFTQKTDCNRYSAQDITDFLQSHGHHVRKVSLLHGGFSNINFKITTDQQSFVARIYPKQKEVALREAAILKMAHNNNVPVPTVYQTEVFQDEAMISLVSLIQGQTLEQVLRHSSKISRQIFFNIGVELAHVHSIHFPKAGLIGPSGKVEQPFGETFNIREEFIDKALQDRAGARLGKELSGRLTTLLDRYWSLTQELASSPVLVHCDFNPKNIMINETNQQITILDWEFSIAADPLIDIANFLRFDEDYQLYMIEAFLEGYQQVSGKLPEHWPLAAKLHDLVSMVSFLNRQENYPETFNTALYIINKTLAFFDRL